MKDLEIEIMAQVTKTQTLADRLAAIPAEIAAATPTKAKTLAAEWAAVRSDHDLAEMISAELQAQQHLAQRAELQAELDHEAELLSKAKIKNRQAVRDLDVVLTTLRRHHNDPALRGVAPTKESETAYVELRAERGRIEGRVRLSAGALRTAEARCGRARADLETFDR